MVLLGKRIKDLRNSYRLTQTELAVKVGVTKSTIAAYENDSRAPSYDVLLNLARVLHVTTDTLLSSEAETVIRAEDLTDEQIHILDTIVESFKAANLLRSSAESERAVADVMDEYRAFALKNKNKRSVKRENGEAEKPIEKNI